MARVEITCPNTGKAVAVEMEAGEPRSDTAAVPEATVKCPHCHDFHTWRKEGAAPERD